MKHERAKENEKLRAWASLAINLVIIVSVAYSVGTSVFGGGGGNMTGGGVVMFRYFTIDSNILAGIASVVLVPVTLRGVVSGSFEVGRGVLLLKHAATVSVMITFLTCVFFLGPTMGFGMIFLGKSFFMHASTPILSLLSLVLVEAPCGEPIRFSHSLLGWATMLVYGVVYVTLVVFVGEASGGWPDFYGFNVGGMWWISLPVMVVVCFGINAGVWKLGRLGAKGGE